MYWLVEPLDGKRIPRLVQSTHHRGAQSLANTHRLSLAALVTPEKIRAFYRQKIDEGSKSRTVGLIHAALHRALEDAVKQGLVARNVAKLVSPPRIDRYDAHTLTVEQAEKLLEAARGSRLDVLLILALTTGMR